MRLLRQVLFVVLPLFLAVMGLVAPSVAHAAETPTAIPSSLQTLIDEGVVSDGTVSEVEYDDYFGGNLPPGSVVVINRGTDDGGMRPRVDAITGTRPTIVVEYPESFWPVITGKSGAVLPFFAPTYDQSKAVLIENNLKVMRVVAEDGSITYVVWNGYSQGADGLGDTVVLAVAEGIDTSKMVFIIDSDPSGPWSIKARLQQLPLLPLAMKLVGVTPTGARDPQLNGDAYVVERIVTADPVGNWQWRWDRPVSSLLVNLAGAIGCHANSACYGNTEQYGAPAIYQAPGTNTYYVVYRSAHPVTLAAETIASALGITLSDTQLARIDAAAEAWYPISVPTPENAAVPVETLPAAVAETTSARAASADESAPVANDEGNGGDEPVVAETITPSGGSPAPSPAPASSDKPVGGRTANPGTETDEGDSPDTVTNPDAGGDETTDETDTSDTSDDTRSNSSASGSNNNRDSSRSSESGNGSGKSGSKSSKSSDNDTSNSNTESHSSNNSEGGDSTSAE